MTSSPTVDDVVGAGWDAPTPWRPVTATVHLPGSKSLTNRYLVLAALADEPSRLRAPLRSRDTLLMAEGLRRLGAVVRDGGTPGGQVADWFVTPIPRADGGPGDSPDPVEVFRMVCTLPSCTSITSCRDLSISTTRPPDDFGLTETPLASA